MYSLTAHNAQQVFEHQYDRLLMNGYEKGEGDSATLCLHNQTMMIQNPHMNKIITPWRKWSESYAEREWKWYLSGNRNPQEVKEVASLWAKMEDENGLVWSNYGYWWKRNNQLEKMIKLLKETPKTRRAILVHYSVDEVQNFEKDTPCNVVLNFYRDQKDQLQLTVFARSIDLWFGFCNDQYCFSRLQIDIAKQLKCALGSMLYFVTDLHLYRKDWEKKGLWYKENHKPK